MADPISERLHALRKERGLNRNDVAERSGISPAVLMTAELENSKVLSDNQLARVSKVLNVDSSYFRPVVIPDHRQQGYLYALRMRSKFSGEPVLVTRVLFQMLLTKDQVATLQDCLKAASSKLFIEAPETWDEMAAVRYALEQFETKTGLFCQFAASPITQLIEF